MGRRSHCVAPRLRHVVRLVSLCALAVVLTSATTPSGATTQGTVHDTAAAAKIGGPKEVVAPLATQTNWAGISCYYLYACNTTIRCVVCPAISIVAISQHDFTKCHCTECTRMCGSVREDECDAECGFGRGSLSALLGRLECLFGMRATNKHLCFITLMSNWRHDAAIVSCTHMMCDASECVSGGRLNAPLVLHI